MNSARVLRNIAQSIYIFKRKEKPSPLFLYLKSFIGSIQSHQPVLSTLRMIAFPFLICMHRTGFILFYFFKEFIALHRTMNTYLNLSKKIILKNYLVYLIYYFLSCFSIIYYFQVRPIFNMCID